MIFFTAIPTKPFQSTPSVWRATAYGLDIIYENEISIHALRVEGDNTEGTKALTEFIFQSTPSVWRATRQHLCAQQFHKRYFNPRPPCGGRLFVIELANAQEVISIHALRVEGDLVHAVAVCQDPIYISIHALRVEGDARRDFPRVELFISIHALRVEGDSLAASAIHLSRISIHALRVEGDADLLRGFGP